MKIIYKYYIILYIKRVRFAACQWRVILMKTISINSAFITLGQLLKYANLLQSGGEAKGFIATNQITVNQVEESRRGRKIYPGDVVVINQTTSLRITKKNEN